MAKTMNERVWVSYTAGASFNIKIGSHEYKFVGPSPIRVDPRDLAYFQARPNLFRIGQAGEIPRGAKSVPIRERKRLAAQRRAQEAANAAKATEEIDDEEAEAEGEEEDETDEDADSLLAEALTVPVKSKKGKNGKKNKKGKQK